MLPESRLPALRPGCWPRKSEGDRSPPLGMELARAYAVIQPTHLGSEAVETPEPSPTCTTDLRVHFFYMLQGHEDKLIHLWPCLTGTTLGIHLKEPHADGHRRCATNLPQQCGTHHGRRHGA